MADARSTKLAAGLRDKTLVKFTRPFEEGSVNGYVLDIGPRWFLLALVSDGIRFNGFQCLRLSDIRELQVPHPNCAFAEAALKKRSERLPKKPRVTVASIEELLLSANRSFPLVTIHRENVSPDVCEIGQIAQVKDGRVSLLEINPDASWMPSRSSIASETSRGWISGASTKMHCTWLEAALLRNNHALQRADRT